MSTDLRRYAEIVRCALRESREVNGTPIYYNPTFDQLVGLVRRFGEMKGHILDEGDYLSVWDAGRLTHYDVVSDMLDLGDDWDALPGFSYSFTPEGVEAESEWFDGSFVEGNGLRLYYNGEASLHHPSIVRLRQRMKPAVNEAILYRGDASRVDRFLLDKTENGALFGVGIYLTDSPEVAADYTFTKGSQHVVFRGLDRDNPPTTVRDLIMQYLRTLIDADGWPEKRKEIWDFYGRKVQQYPDHLPRDEATMRAYWHRENDERKLYTDKLQAEATAALKKEYAKFVTRAKKRLRAERDSLRVVRSTMGTFTLVKNERAGAVSRFDIPDDYLARTLHAERPMPDDVLDILRRIAHERVGDSVVDMRDRDYEKMLNFDDWVENFRQHGTLYSWEYHQIGGKGENPSFDEIRNGTNYFSILFHDRDVQLRFIADMQALGYVGLEYEGGRRIGQNNPRGGGGLRHRAYVLWDEDTVNSFRIDDHDLPPDDEIDPASFSRMRGIGVSGRYYGYH